VNIRALVRSAPPAVVLPEWQPMMEDHGGSQVEVYGYKKPVSVRFRDALRMGERLRGPVLVCEAAATTFIDAGWWGEVDRYGNLFLTKQ
jgi:N-methylhydantoinase A/oxoprolinase/acetone carboxylase beta subunit